jgi:hypothetical protein
MKGTAEEADEKLGLHQGMTSQAAEKFTFLKGTALRPYITAV